MSAGLWKLMTLQVITNISFCESSNSSFIPDYPACFQNSSNELPKITFHEAVVCLKVPEKILKNLETCT